MKPKKPYTPQKESPRKGVQDGHSSAKGIDKIRALRKKQLSVEALTEKLLSGDTVALSQGITLIESTKPEQKEASALLLKNCLPNANNSIRIGITGVPGVGKSTFIEALGGYLTSKGKKVAVLAVDPSSSVSKGSILGDKTRMNELVRDPSAFIRPSAAGTSLGGVARKTRESIMLCEAAGFDTVIIETVGVGQSETAVHSMVDFFLLLKLSGAGDQLQGIKRGIMEMADAIIINKADGDNKRNAEQAKTEFQRALHLFPPKDNGWTPKVLTASSTAREGIEDSWGLITSFISQMKEKGEFSHKRRKQNKYWLLQTIEEELKESFYNDQNVKAILSEKIQDAEESRISPFEAAKELLRLYRAK